MLHTTFFYFLSTQSLYKISRQNTRLNLDLSGILCYSICRIIGRISFCRVYYWEWETPTLCWTLSGWRRGVFPTQPMPPCLAYARRNVRRMPGGQFFSRGRWQKPKWQDPRESCKTHRTQASTARSPVVRDINVNQHLPAVGKQWWVGDGRTTAKIFFKKFQKRGWQAPGPVV